MLMRAATVMQVLRGLFYVLLQLFYIVVAAIKSFKFYCKCYCSCDPSLSDQKGKANCCIVQRNALRGRPNTNYCISPSWMHHSVAQLTEVAAHVIPPASNVFEPVLLNITYSLHILYELTGALAETLCKFSSSSVHLGYCSSSIFF